MRKIVFYFIIIVFTGCSKKHEPLFGIVKVAGTANDIMSNAPVANGIVQLVRVKLGNNGLGGTSAQVTDDIVAQDTTDSFGNYSITFNANGQYELLVKAKSINPLYGHPVAVDIHEKWIRNLGDHIVNLKCHRSAHAKVAIINVPPIDTSTYLILESSNRIVLPNFYKDTVVFLKLIGRTEIPNGIIFEKRNQYYNVFDVTAGPWDTISLQFNY